MLYILFQNYYFNAGKYLHVNFTLFTETMFYFSAKSLDVSDLNLKNEGYGQIKSYAKSKLANILFTKGLDRRYKDLHVYSYAVHPGTVSTELSAHVEARFPEWFNKTIGEVFKAIFLKTSENGAQTSIYCAIQPDPRLLSGSYFS